MVRVISKKPVKAKVKKLVCEGCGYKLEYTPEDVKMVEYTCCGKPESDWCVQCPRSGCKTYNTVTP